tara:strand:+ start:267 stop:719 length:453 start_codon:yes stop_codon:yes gene_type:complete
METVRPLGKITTTDANTLDAAYPSGNGGGVLGAKEILRATTVRVDNQSDFPIVVRLVQVNALFPATGEPQSVFQQNSVETFNYYDMIVKPAETVYVSKQATATVLDDPNVPTYVEVPPTAGETIQLRLAPNVAAGAANGFIYASPVTIDG